METVSVITMGLLVDAVFCEPGDCFCICLTSLSSRRGGRVVLGASRCVTVTSIGTFSAKLRGSSQEIDVESRKWPFSAWKLTKKCHF